MVSIQLLKENNLLSELPASLLEKLVKKMKIHRFAKGEFVVFKGQESDSMLFVLSGELHVVDINEQGQNVWLGRVLERSSTGELGIVTGEQRSASLVAATESLIGFLSKHETVKLITSEPSVSWKVMQSLAGMIKNNNSQLNLINLPNVQQRIETILTQKISQQVTGSMNIELPAQHIIANMANTSRESVARVLSKLVKSGVLEKVSPKVYRVLQPDLIKDYTL